MVSPGWLAEPGLRGEMAFTTSMPSVALPKTACRPSRCGCDAKVMKNWLSFVFGAGPSGRAARNADFDGPYTSSIKIV